MSGWDGVAGDVNEYGLTAVTVILGHSESVIKERRAVTHRIILLIERF